MYSTKAPEIKGAHYRKRTKVFDKDELARTLIAENVLEKPKRIHGQNLSEVPIPGWKRSSKFPLQNSLFGQNESVRSSVAADTKYNSLMSNRLISGPNQAGQSTDGAQT